MMGKLIYDEFSQSLWIDAETKNILGVEKRQINIPCNFVVIAIERY